MKKYLVLLCLVFSIFIITGCDKKKVLECTSIDNSSDVAALNVIYDFEYEEETLKKIIQTVNSDVPKYSSSEREIVLYTLKEGLNERLKDEKGVKIETKQKESNISATVTVDMTIYEGTHYKDFKNMDMDKIKEALKEKNFTCKIK